ncbi:MAG: hypothetical protein ABIR17_07990 [Pseudolysinimonas sp.]|uniref:hypothetical protein n=1 Tax=Pseudolysinimonas sp. TaxID=2680009 RepID=UPI003266543A
MRRAVVPWLVAALLATAAATGGVWALNATTFGPAGFVRVYLEAVARGDATGALGLAGVTVDPAARTDFLNDRALVGLTDLREVSEVPGDDGTTVVTFAWRAPSGDGLSSFTVRAAGTRFAIFPRWEFAISPVATLHLTVEHDQRFTINGIDATSGVDAADPVDYAVLVPGDYTIDHTSTYLQAEAVVAIPDRPSSTIAESLDIEPSPAFASRVMKEVDATLTTCATQLVLFPTGCPLGHSIADRVVSTPTWSIVDYPNLDIVASATFGQWSVPPTTGTAHLTVDVKSLFDGTVTTFDDDVEFTVRFGVTIEPDDTTLRIVPHYDD